MIDEDIIRQLKDWKNVRKAASFDIKCNNKDEALSKQSELRILGFKGFVTTMGEWVGIVLYLNDNK